MAAPLIASSLFDLPVSTSLSEVERSIVRAFLRNGARRPAWSYERVYADVARRLQLSVVEVKRIERAMVQRVGVVERDEAVEAHVCGHGAAILSLCSVPVGGRVPK